jgi:TPP-dependent 2-oxoacid decarboxylase
MKKLLFVMVLVMGALAVNAQRTPVKVTDLQKSITDNIAKDYAGFTIKEATKVVENNVTTFDVVVTKGTTQETLCYDNTGKFLKKMGEKTGTTKEAPKTHPASTTPPKKK